MFEFTKRARNVLEILAQTEAKRLNSDSIGPEHIMVSLLKDNESVAAKILKNLGVNFERLMREIEQAVRQAGSTIILGKVPINPRYKKIIELSREEARKLKNSYIGTEHLLLAIFREGSCAGLESLIRAGIDYNIIRSEILRVLGVKLNPIPPEQTKNTNPPPNANANGNANINAKQKQGTKPPALEEFSQDLTKLAEENMLDPVIGRDEEINRVIRILSRKRKNNPILIGDAGVGKTAIVEGLAQCIVKKQVPDVLTESRVLALDMAAIVAGTKYRGEFEERLKRIVEEIKSAKNIIIFIDEVHSIIGAGAAEGAIDAANILKPALARGELQCIGATTLNEYKMYIEKDTALVRRFQSVLVEEPDVNETIEILHGLKGRYELHHKVKYDEEALVKAAVLADRYISDRALPDKAIDLLDEAGAMARLSNHDRPIDIVVLEEEIEALNKGKNELVLSQEYEKAAAIRDQINEKREVLAVKLVDWQERRNDYVVRVGVEEIAEIISESTGIPAESLDEGESKKLLTMENELHQKIIGQDDAIVAISKAIRRARVGLSSYDRPKGTFLFLGPTGVGKTELAKVLAEFLFNDEKNLIRLDMSEYMEKHSVSRLIGAPPGYIGYEEGGQLTEKVRRRHYSVILLDEIEKAHPDVYNILLQIFEEGDLTDGSGITVNFRETIIIITSNIGNREYQKMGRLGFSNYEPGVDSNNDKVTEELRKTFNPELLNRLDSVIFFHKLTREHIRDIIDLMLEEINERLKDRDIILDFTPALKKHILEKGFDDRYGARNLRRVIQNEIEDTIASEFLTGCYDKASKIQVSFKKDKITLKIVKLDPAEWDTGHDENSGDPEHSEKIITNGHTH